MMNKEHRDHRKFMRIGILSVFLIAGGILITQLNEDIGAIIWGSGIVLLFVLLFFFNPLGNPLYRNSNK